MDMVVLQLADPGPIPDWALVYMQAVDVLSALIGIFISYQAYRGYRRNESKPMLYISIGFVLVLAVPFVLLVALVLIPFVPVAAVGIVQQTSQVLGLLAIVYALRMPG